MKTIPVKVTYLQMFHQPERDTLRPMPNVEIVLQRPTVAFYRFLYDAVGRDWNWIERKRMSDEELGQIIHDDRVEILVLYVDDTPAGFAELDRRVEGEIELRYFGITPEFFGKGLGRYFLKRTIERAWSYAPKRFWLHTCELDHAAALPLYRKMGFEVYDQQATVPSNS